MDKTDRIMIKIGYNLKNFIVISLLLFFAKATFGQSILFSQNVSDNWDIYLLDAKENSVERLTKNSKRDFQADFSARTKLIIFDSYRENDARNIFSLNLKTKKIRQITFLKTRDGHPVWSSDGQKIAFQSSRTGDSEVFVMKKSGSKIRQITNNAGFDGIPVWSPDDKKLAFNTSRHGNPDVYIYDFKSQKQIRVTTGSSADFIQDWSRKDNSLLILSDHNGKNHLYKKDLAKNSLTPLKTAYEVTYARFDKRGEKIVFTAKTARGVNIFVMNSDGSGLRQLTDSETDKRFPAFAGM
jgi:Tol biopolymer transport system component